MNIHHCYRLRVRDIEHLIRLTESLPGKNCHSEILTQGI